MPWSDYQDGAQSTDVANMTFIESEGSYLSDGWARFDTLYLVKHVELLDRGSVYDPPGYGQFGNKQNLAGSEFGGGQSGVGSGYYTECWLQANAPEISIDDVTLLASAGKVIDADYALIPGKSLSDPHPYVDYEGGSTGSVVAWDVPDAFLYAQNNGAAGDGQSDGMAAVFLDFTEDLSQAESFAVPAHGPGSGAGALTSVSIPVHVALEDTNMPVTIPITGLGTHPFWSLRVKDSRVSGGIGVTGSDNYRMRTWVRFPAWPTVTHATPRWRYWIPGLSATPDRLIVAFSGT